MIDVRMFTVGPVQENCFIVRQADSSTGLIVDPGDEPDRILAAVDGLGIEKVEAILNTHTHFDHVGAVAPVALATGAPGDEDAEVAVLPGLEDLRRQLLLAHRRNEPDIRQGTRHLLKAGATGTFAA